MVFSVLVLVEEVVVHELGKIAFVGRAANCAVGFVANFRWAATEGKLTSPLWLVTNLSLKYCFGEVFLRTKSPISSTDNPIMMHVEYFIFL